MDAGYPSSQSERACRRFDTRRALLSVLVSLACFLAFPTKLLELSVPVGLAFPVPRTLPGKPLPALAGCGR